MPRERDLQDKIDILAENPRATPEQVENMLAQLTQRRESEALRQMYEARIERGHESEERVKRVLEAFDIVDSVRETAQGSWEDLAARDLVVNFERNQHVFVQVKSSERAIKEFIGDEKRARKKLIVRRLIVINGQEDEEKIRNNFLNDLKAVDDYWRKRDAPILSPSLRNLLDSNLAEVYLE